MVDLEKASCYLSRHLSLLAEGWLLSVLSSILVSDDKNLFRTSLMRTWCQGIPTRQVEKWLIQVERSTCTERGISCAQTQRLVSLQCRCFLFAGVLKPRWQRSSLVVTRDKVKSAGMPLASISTLHPVAVRFHSHRGRTPYFKYHTSKIQESESFTPEIGSQLIVNKRSWSLEPEK